MANGGNIRARDEVDGVGIRQALKKLSGLNVTASKLADGGAVLAAQRNGPTHRCGELSQSVWAILEARGWVVGDSAERWRLSNAGRIHLKRLMSRSAAIQSVSTAMQPDARTGPSEGKINPSESPLAWLYRRTDRDGKPLISPEQFEAGERLRADFERGSMGPRLTVNWSCAGGLAPGSAGRDHEIELRGHAIAARERVRAALAAVGPELSGILIDVCCHLRGLTEVERGSGWPQRTAKVVLLMALSRLARHYGLVSQEVSMGNRVRHWGGEDYRPVLGTDA